MNPCCIWRAVPTPGIHTLLVESHITSESVVCEGFCCGRKDTIIKQHTPQCSEFKSMHNASETNWVDQR